MLHIFLKMNKIKISKEIDEQNKAAYGTFFSQDIKREKNNNLKLEGNIDQLAT